MLLGKASEWHSTVTLAWPRYTASRWLGIQNIGGTEVTHQVRGQLGGSPMLGRESYNMKNLL